VLDSPTTSRKATDLVRRILLKYEKTWGSGDDGTVAREHLTFADRNRPKGILLYALMASFLDPRFMFGTWLNMADKNYIYEKICEELVLIA
jgi:hypothetical protein